MSLYHISEKPDIKVFEPKAATSLNSGVEGNAVWAIDKEHLVNYFFPRDCPRISFYYNTSTTKEDSAKFFKGTKAKRIIYAEEFWKNMITEARLIQYEFDDAGFELIDEIAGYYICKNKVVPKREMKISDTVQQIFNDRAELRYLQNLWEIREEVLNSSLAFSIIRMRNAQLPEDGDVKFTPIPD